MPVFLKCFKRKILKIGGDVNEINKPKKLLNLFSVNILLNDPKKEVAKTTNNITGIYNKIGSLLLTIKYRIDTPYKKNTIIILT